MLLDRTPNLKPSAALPSTRVDLKALPPGQDVVVWLGHSSYFVQLDGKRILLDPVFSTDAGPFPRTNVAFPGTSPYVAEDMPPIDVLLITHDHRDHLDYPSTIALLPKVGQVVVGLGVGEYFDRWGYPSENGFGKLGRHIGRRFSPPESFRREKCDCYGRLSYPFGLSTRISSSRVAFMLQSRTSSKRHYDDPNAHSPRGPRRPNA